jgi:hypothetical protein
VLRKRGDREDKGRGEIVDPEASWRQFFARVACDLRLCERSGRREAAKKDKKKLSDEGKKPAQAGLKAEQMTNGELQLRHNKTRRVWDNFSLFLYVLSCARATVPYFTGRS